MIINRNFFERSKNFKNILVRISDLNGFCNEVILFGRYPELCTSICNISNNQLKDFPSGVSIMGGGSSAVKVPA